MNYKSQFRPVMRFLAKGLFSLLFLILISPVSTTQAQVQEAISLKNESPKTEKTTTGRQLGGDADGRIGIHEVYLVNAFENPQIWIDTEARVFLRGMRRSAIVRRTVSVWHSPPGSITYTRLKPLNDGDDPETRKWSIQLDNTRATYDDQFELEFLILPRGKYRVQAFLEIELFGITIPIQRVSAPFYFIRN